MSCSKCSSSGKWYIIIYNNVYILEQPNGWKSTGSNCPSEGGDLFCLNGGTCVFFKDVGEPACKWVILSLTEFSFLPKLIYFKLLLMCVNWWLLQEKKMEINMQH
jgi:hypothetical protein